MSKYTPSELETRNAIMQTHHLFGDVLDVDMITALVYLFDDIHNDTIYSMRKYVEEERMNRGLEQSSVQVSCDISGISYKNPLLCVDIKKNGKKFIHLTIHLVMHTLESKNNGMIHFEKDIYKISKTRKFYAPIIVIHPNGKPHSLEFSIPEEYRTTPGAPNASIYDIEVQQEMDAIIAVLNRIFDEKNKRYYIGTVINQSSNELLKIYPSYRTTNNTLLYMNTQSKIKTRRNTGKYPLPARQNQYPNMIYPIVRRTITKKNKRRTTRKIKK
jgi:hypothetical protein